MPMFMHADTKQTIVALGEGCGFMQEERSYLLCAAHSAMVIKQQAVSIEILSYPLLPPLSTYDEMMQLHWALFVTLDKG